MTPTPSIEVLRGCVDRLVRERRPFVPCSCVLRPRAVAFAPAEGGLWKARAFQLPPTWGEALASCSTLELEDPETLKGRERLVLRLEPLPGGAQKLQELVKGRRSSQNLPGCSHGKVREGEVPLRALNYLRRNSELESGSSARKLPATGVWDGKLATRWVVYEPLPPPAPPPVALVSVDF